MATITSVLVEGSGVRLTWSNGHVDQLIQSFNRQTKSVFLSRDGKTPLTFAEVEELISNINLDSNTATLLAHLAGTAGAHLQTLATTQIGSSIVQNTWTILSWDSVQLESHDNSIQFIGSGLIRLKPGEYRAVGQVLLHDTAALLVTVASQLYNHTTNSEVDYSFSIDTKVGLLNGPVSLRTEVVLDIQQTTDVSLRVRADTTTAVFGTHASFIPAGSSNYAGVLLITKFG